MSEGLTRTEVVRRALRDAAEADRPCPSNWALAELIDAAHAYIPSAIISRLEAQDEFRVQREHWGRRIVYADGLMTGLADYVPATAKRLEVASIAPTRAMPKRTARGAPCRNCGCRADACSCPSFAETSMPCTASSAIVSASSYSPGARQPRGMNG